MLILKTEKGVGAYLVGFTRSSVVVVATAKSSREKGQ